MSQGQSRRWTKNTSVPASAPEPIPPWRQPWAASSSRDSWEERQWQGSDVVAYDDWTDPYSWEQPRTVSWNSGDDVSTATWDYGSSAATPWDYGASTYPTSQEAYGVSTYSTFPADVPTEEWPAEESLQSVPPSPPLGKRRIHVAPTIEFLTYNLDGKQPIEKDEKVETP